MKCLSLFIYFLSQSRKLLPLTSEKWSCERSRACVFIQAEQLADITPDLAAFFVGALSKSFCERIKLWTIGLHQILGEEHQPPRQGMRSSAASLDKKRFIGEHRGEFKAEGWEGRVEAHRSRARSYTESSEQLTLPLGWVLKGRNSSLFSVHYILMPTCTTCFKQETLTYWSAFAKPRRWLHFIWMTND